MKKKTLILVLLSTIGLCGCEKEYYINDGCEVDRTYCIDKDNDNAVYKCVNAESEGLAPEEFADPEFDKKKASDKETKTFWKRIPCYSQCTTDNSGIGSCFCSDKCMNGCNDDGSCKGCIHGLNDDGTCKCPDGCDKCDLNGNSCCDEKCEHGCEPDGTCSCPECEADEYCEKGRCVFWDRNNNHLHDKYENALKQGMDCRKYTDCDSSEGAEDGFCDSYLGYKCSTRCTDNSQCVDDKDYHYICRPDGRCAPDVFVTVWDIPEDNKFLRIPTRHAEACNFTVEWGDGEKSEDCVKNGSLLGCNSLGEQTVINDGYLLHEYKNKGEYTVNITGRYDGFGWENEFKAVGLDFYYLYNKGGVCNSEPCDSSPFKLIDIKAFGPVGLEKLTFVASKLSKISAVDIPDASKMHDLSYAFYWNSSDSDSKSVFNSPIEHWDVSYVTRMHGMFQNAEIFNQPLERWDTSNVTDMGWMFMIATQFDQSLGDWKTGNVTDMNRMFAGAQVFNQPLNHWDTSNVTDMSYMFSGANLFDQELSNWKLNVNVNPEMMFEGSSLSKENYCKTLNKWQETNNNLKGLGLDYECSEEP